MNKKLKKKKTSEVFTDTLSTSVQHLDYLDNSSTFTEIGSIAPGSRDDVSRGDDLGLAVYNITNHLNPLALDYITSSWETSEYVKTSSSIFAEYL